MDPKLLLHSPPALLADFAAGKLGDAECDEIVAHLDACSACRQVLASLPPDSISARIQGAGSEDAPLPTGSWSGASPSMLDAMQRGEPIDEVQTPPELVNHPKFQLLRQLGCGGMGVVFLAEHRMMGRRVAIKVINKSLIESAETLLRFTAEVRAAAKLSHPNIVQAYDAEQAGDLHFLVMEFVEGKNLAELLEERQKPLSIRHACHYARQVAKGLHHAWERKMVHRDIKPHNLMLTSRGQIKILDFGLARMVRERTAKSGLTSVDSFMGTPEYVAPEQAADARQADIRADLYSLGCTLYYLLAGRPPFREDTAMKVVLAHVSDAPEPLPNLRSDVPEELWVIIAKLLAKNPAARYQTPSEVAAALAPFAKEASTTTPKENLPPPLASPSRVTYRKTETSKIAKSPPSSSPREQASALPSLPKSASALPHPLRSRTRLVAVGLLLGLIAVACLATAIVLRIRTKEGTIVIRDLPADSRSQCRRRKSVTNDKRRQGLRIQDQCRQKTLAGSQTERRHEGFC